MEGVLHSNSTKSTDLKNIGIDDLALKRNSPILSCLRINFVWGIEHARDSCGAHSGHFGNIVDSRGLVGMHGRLSNE
jgi:hypothetical protein